MRKSSAASDTKEIADYVEFLELVLLVEISVISRLPEAAGGHVKASFRLLEHNKCCHKLVLLANLFLAVLDDFFGTKVGPLLGMTSIVLLGSEVLLNKSVANILDSIFDLAELFYFYFVQMLRNSVVPGVFVHI